MRIPVVLLVLLAACTGAPAETDETDPTDTDTEGDTDTADTDDTDAADVDITGTLMDFASASPLPGATVCVHAETDGPCATSDGDGRWTLTLPAGTNGLVLSVEAAEHVPMRIMYGLADPAHSQGFFVTSRAAMAALLAQGNLTWEEGTTGIVQFSLSDGTAGVAVSLSPAAGQGPFYVDRTSGIQDTTATTASTTGGGFVGVPPGSYETVFTGSTACHPAFGWDGTAAGSVVTTVEAGAITAVFGMCD